MFLLPAMVHVPTLPVHQIGDCVRRALVLAQIPIKDACERMGIDQSEFSRQLNVRGCNIARLALIGPDFMSHFLALLAETTHAEPPSRGSVETRLQRLEAMVRDLWSIVVTRKAEIPA